MTLSDKALTTVEAVEHELGLSHWQEPRIEGWIEIASEMIAEYLGRELYRRAAISEKHRGDGSPFLVLKDPPINTLTSILFNGTALASGDYEIDDADAGVVYFIGNPMSWNAYVGEGVSRPMVPGTERKTYTAVYDGGWITPGQSEAVAGVYTGQTVTVPKPIQRAAILTVVDALTKAGQNPDIKSESALSYSVTYKGTSDDVASYGLPAYVCAMLKPWKLED